MRNERSDIRGFFPSILVCATLCEFLDLTNFENYQDLVYKNILAESSGMHIMGLQTDRIYCHINGLKTQHILIASFEHVLMVKPLRAIAKLS